MHWVKIFGDSQLVIKQITHEYKCVNEAKYFAILGKLLYKFDDMIIKHKPRIQNTKANELTHIALSITLKK